MSACSSGAVVPQAAQASVRVAAAMAALGCGAEMANLRGELPLLLGAAPALTRARAQLALAEGLLVGTSAAELTADPDRCAPVRCSARPACCRSRGMLVRHGCTTAGQLVVCLPQAALILEFLVLAL